MLFQTKLSIYCLFPIYLLDYKDKEGKNDAFNTIQSSGPRMVLAQ